MITLPEIFKSIQLLPPTATNGITTTIPDYVSLKNAIYAWIVISERATAAVATVWQPTMATDVAGTGETSVTASVNIWSNEDTATSDTLVKRTAAASYTQTADTNNKIIIFGIDPAILFATTAGAAQTFYDCITVLASTGSASNDASIMVYIETRYPQSNPPTGITD